MCHYYLQIGYADTLIYSLYGHSEGVTLRWGKDTSHTLSALDINDDPIYKLSYALYGQIGVKVEGRLRTLVQMSNDCSSCTNNMHGNGTSYGEREIEREGNLWAQRVKYELVGHTEVINEGG